MNLLSSSSLSSFATLKGICRRFLSRIPEWWMNSLKLLAAPCFTAHPRELQDRAVAGGVRRQADVVDVRVVLVDDLGEAVELAAALNALLQGGARQRLTLGALAWGRDERAC